MVIIIKCAWCGKEGYPDTMLNTSIGFYCGQNCGIRFLHDEMTKILKLEDLEA